MILLGLKDLFQFLSPIGYFLWFWFFVRHSLKAKLICENEMEAFILKFIVLDIFSISNVLFP